MSTAPPPADRSAAPAAAGFQQRLGLFDATMLVTGSMIGSGIYVVSAEMARDVGSAGWLLGVWIVTGIITVFGALSYAELAAMMPRAGGQYVYLREAFGPLWGFLYGWTLFLVIQTGTIAAVGVAFSKFLGVFVPALGNDPKLGAWTLWITESFRITAGQVVGVITVIVLTIINCRGVQEGKFVQNLFTVTKAGTLALLVVLGLTVAARSDVWSANTADLWGGMFTTEAFTKVNGFIPFTGAAVLMVAGGAMVGSLFSADAWNNVTFTAGEVRNPQRNLPLSLILGTGGVILLYILANIAYVACLPVIGDAGAVGDVRARGISHAADERVATAVVELVAPGVGVSLMAAAIMISTFGCNNGLILSGARLYYAMARDGLFFKSVGRLNDKGVPAAGLILQAIWASVLTFSGKYGDLLDYVIFAALLFYVLTVAGLFVLRRTRPDAERPYKVIGYPVLPAVYVVLCAVVMLDLLVVKPVYTWPGLIIVLTGVPVYFVWRSLTGGSPPNTEDTMAAYPVKPTAAGESDKPT
jgi:APA family basic amino acid/polyamine antiporter